MSTIPIARRKERSRYATGNNAFFARLGIRICKLQFCIISDFRIESDRALKWHVTETNFIRYISITRSDFFCAGESIYLCLCLNRERRRRSEANTEICSQLNL